MRVAAARSSGVMRKARCAQHLSPRSGADVGQCIFPIGSKVIFVPYMLVGCCLFYPWCCFRSRCDLPCSRAVTFYVKKGVGG